MTVIHEQLPPSMLIQRASSPFPFLVVIGPYAASAAMLAFTARLALHTSLRVLDGGNRFNAREVARILRGLNAPDLYAALDRIRLARAFTCYQMLALLEQTPPSPHPTLVIDLLDTFYDESASLSERRRLAESCLTHLHHLSLLAPVAASIRPPHPSKADPSGLLELVQQSADSLWFQEDDTLPGSARQAPPSQLSLF
jgi:hypothetical protein